MKSYSVGHAIMSVLNKNSTPLYKVTILPKAHSLGHTAFIPEKDELSHTKKQLLARIEVALGGKAAEEIFLGEGKVTTGCSSDLDSATRVAYFYVRNMGMTEDLSVLSGNKGTFSDDHNYALDVEANRLIQESYKRVKTIMLENQEAIHRISKRLIEKETLGAEEFKELLGIKTQPPRTPPPPKPTTEEEGNISAGPKLRLF